MQQDPDDTDARRNHLLIVAAAIADPFQSAHQIKTALNLQASEETIRRHMREAGLRGFVAAQKPHLTERQNHRRLEFSRAYMSAGRLKNGRKSYSQMNRHFHLEGINGAAYGVHTTSSSEMASFDPAGLLVALSDSDSSHSSSSESSSSSDEDESYVLYVILFNEMFADPPHKRPKIVGYVEEDAQCSCRCA
ncbi:hypothetical protein HPB49_022682 [Dermacentor silvarum]|uniref:Uncharacterized protein n=1 Tax=Dermacentor silvarum TaxID=543639 RepID=A0ACB8D0G2_DERSI|nr:hypothetical protein HPB49_022682 [Dermacentor silvarum]